MSDNIEIANLQDALTKLVQRLGNTPKSTEGGTTRAVVVEDSDIELLSQIAGSLVPTKDARALCLTQAQLQAILFAMANVMARISAGERLGPENAGVGH